MYTGTAGRIENCQVGVFAAYVTPDGGRALIDRELYLPEKWTDDRDRCRAAGIGDDVGVRDEAGAGPEDDRARAWTPGVPFSWVAGDEVYGGNPKLRAWLEEQGIPYVMAVACSEIDRRWRPGGMRADELAALVPKDGWQRLSCADGSKGPRLYDWALIGTAAPGHHLLVRRSLRPGREGPAGAGVLPLLVAPPGHPARARRRGRRALGSRGLLRRGEERGRPGPLPGPQVPRLVPARHPVHARARVPRRHRPRLPARHPAPGPASGNGQAAPLKRGPDPCGQRFAPPRTYAPPAFVTDETGRDLIPLTAAEARRLFNLHTPRHPARPHSTSTGQAGDATARPPPANPTTPAELRNHKTLL